MNVLSDAEYIWWHRISKMRREINLETLRDKKARVWECEFLAGSTSQFLVEKKLFPFFSIDV